MLLIVSQVSNVYDFSFSKKNKNKGAVMTMEATRRGLEMLEPKSSTTLPQEKC